jgi:hypothetical protein
MFLHYDDMNYFISISFVLSCPAIAHSINLLFYWLQTVDQFFGLKVPMRFTELNSLFRGIDNALQVYANLVVNDLGE